MVPKISGPEAAKMCEPDVSRRRCDWMFCFSFLNIFKHNGVGDFITLRTV